MDFRPRQHHTLLAGLRHDRRGLLISLLLSLLFVAQALLPIQSHTRWTVTGDGKVVEICTLKGTVAMTLHQDMDHSLNHDTAPAGQDDDRSAAMSFSLLLAEALDTHYTTQPAWLALVSTPVPPARIGSPAQQSLRHAPIRAPPAIA